MPYNKLGEWYDEDALENVLRWRWENRQMKARNAIIKPEKELSPRPDIDPFISMPNIYRRVYPNPFLNPQINVIDFLPKSKPVIQAKGYGIGATKNVSEPKLGIWG